MSEQVSSSNNSTLYFLVGGLLVAVLAVGYFAMGRDRSGDAAVSAPPPATSGTAEESDSLFKLDVERDGSVSGSIDQKAD